MSAICASFADFKLIKGRKVCQLVCEVPLEQADAALAALGGLPNPHAERWVGIAPLKEQPQVQPSPGPAGDGGSTAVSSPASTPQAQPRGAAAAATKPERKWDDIPPSQQAGIACERDDFRRWVQRDAPIKRWNQERAVDHPWWGKSVAVDAAEAAQYIRWYCGVSSRSELDTNPEAAARWRDLYGKFQADTRYGDRR